MRWKGRRQSTNVIDLRKTRALRIINTGGMGYSSLADIHIDTDGSHNANLLEGGGYYLPDGTVTIGIQRLAPITFTYTTAQKNTLRALLKTIQFPKGLEISGDNETLVELASSLLRNLNG